MKRTNLYELYKDEITGNESVLDVGCGMMEDLVCFEDSPFKDLYGIERKYLDHSDYSASRSIINDKKPLANIEFMERYKLQEANIQDCAFGINRHNFIICRNVLHFFPDPEKMPLIERMHTALASGGLLYLQLYHATSPKVIENYEHLGMNTYGKDGFSDKYYLIDHNLFMEEVKRKYHTMNIERPIDENWIRLVIKKS